MAKVTSKIISALERYRGSWEIVSDILICNPSCSKFEKINQQQSQFREEKAITWIYQCTTFCFRQIKLYNNLFSFFFLRKLSQHSAELAVHSLHFSSVDLHNFRINVNDFQHSHLSGIFNKHSATYCLRERPNVI